MAYSAMTAKATGDLIDETEWDKLKNNWDWIAAGGVAGSPFSGMSSFPTDMSRIAVGTYTGDGGATKAITGVGFQPRIIAVYRQSSTAETFAWKTSSDTSTNGKRTDDSTYGAVGLNSLDADGFTVSGTMNTSAAVYTYIAWR